MLSLKFPLVLILLSSLPYSAISQNFVPDTASSPAYKNAVALYNQSLAEELHMFNGREYKGYPYNFTAGTPYFLTDDWSTGTLNYEGKIYDSVKLLYDAHADELINLYYNKVSRIRLIKEKISGFSIMGHRFIQITTDSSKTAIAPGFYDELYHGKISLLAKRTKTIQSFIRQSGEEFRVFSKDHYYVRKGENYYPVSNKRSFLETVEDKRKELQQFIRQNKLNFKKDTENAMTKSLAYYDKLTNI